MNEAQALAEIVQTLTIDHGCHAVILYGSRARGDFELASDWDVAGIREGAATAALRGARVGYQFVLGGTFMTVNHTLYKNPLFNAATDFVPVLLTVEQPIVLVARKDIPASNLPEFIAYARANQTTMQYGSAGVGSMPHLPANSSIRRLG